MDRNDNIIPFADLGRMHKSIFNDLMRVTEEIIESSQFVMGKNLSEFEKNFTRYIESKYGAGVASGADALFLSLKAIGIKPGDEVITVNNTFNATVDAIIRAGATPRIVDVNNDDLLMNMELVEKAITEKTKAIIPVHLFGNPVKMDILENLKNEMDGDIKIIQDAAQAHGATLNSKHLGRFVDIVCYSFYPIKNLGALGDGGFIATDDPEIIERVKILRNCGQLNKNNFTVVGFNSRLDDIQAAYLLIKLRKLDEWNQSRRASAELYKEKLQGLENIRITEETKNGKCIFHLYVIRVKQREKLMKIFKKNNVQFGIHYPVSINKSKAYKEFEFAKKSFPVSERAAKEIISLPMFPYMKNWEIDRVGNILKEFSMLS